MCYYLSVASPICHQWFTIHWPNTCLKINIKTSSTILGSCNSLLHIFESLSRKCEWMGICAPKRRKIYFNNFECQCISVGSVTKENIYRKENFSLFSWYKEATHDANASLPKWKFWGKKNIILLVFIVIYNMDMTREREITDHIKVNHSQPPQLQLNKNFIFYILEQLFFYEKIIFLK